MNEPRAVTTTQEQRVLGIMVSYLGSHHPMTEAARAALEGEPPPDASWVGFDKGRGSDMRWNLPGQPAYFASSDMHVLAAHDDIPSPDCVHCQSLIHALVGRDVPDARPKRRWEVYVPDTGAVLSRHWTRSGAARELRRQRDGSYRIISLMNEIRRVPR